MSPIEPKTPVLHYASAKLQNPPPVTREEAGSWASGLGDLLLTPLHLLEFGLNVLVSLLDGF
jgi:hypothetical protein